MKQRVNCVKMKMCFFRKLEGINYPKLYESDYATYVYVALRKMCKSNGSIAVTPQMIFLSLTDKNPNRENIKGIKDGLAVLAECGLISYKKIGCTYNIKTTGLEIPDDKYKFFFIPIEFLNKVMEQRNNIALFHHYVLLCSTINIVSNIGEHSRNSFATKLNLNESTISQHHQLFIDLGLICFSEKKSSVTETGDFANYPKMYVMPEYGYLIGSDTEEEIIKKKVKKVEKENKKKAKVVAQELKQKIIEHDTAEQKKNRINPFESVRTSNSNSCLDKFLRGE